MGKVRRKAKKAKAKKAMAAKALVTRSEAAAAFGVVPSRINRWAADGAPVARHGRPGHGALYDVQALRAWREAQRSGPESGEGAALSLSEEKAKLARAQAKKWEMANALTEGILVERDAVVAEGRAHIAAAKARLWAIPRQAVLNGIIQREQEGALRRLLVEALAELASWKMIHDTRAVGGPAA